MDTQHAKKYYAQTLCTKGLKPQIKAKTKGCGSRKSEKKINYEKKKKINLWVNVGF